MQEIAFATGFAYTQIRGWICLYTNILYEWKLVRIANHLYGEANSSTQPCRAGKLLLLINFTDTNGVGLIVGKSVFPFSAFLLSMNGINRKLVQFFVVLFDSPFFLINKLISSFDIIMTE